MKTIFFRINGFTESPNAKRKAFNREQMTGGWPHFENIQLRNSSFPYQTRASRTIHQKLDPQGSGESSAS
ncbi:hypothetical protein [Pseudomonas sp. GL-B-19]|uniref:hypothetical protein n=1 Tax=Pseudomonas sp. GL-B-19 TaxID=2832393 RepID=UPI001CBF1CF4|nr:hypothetical protein [Pseudomonas sp. GL-B-19]